MKYINYGILCALLGISLANNYMLASISQKVHAMESVCTDNNTYYK